MAAVENRGKIPNLTGQNSKYGFIYPIICWAFFILSFLSLMTYLKSIRAWKESDILKFIDIYVLINLIVGVTLSFIINMTWPKNSNDLIPVWISWPAMAYALLRILDIIQAWWNTYFVRPYKAKAPRNIILLVLNYIEIAIAFAIIGLLMNIAPYNLNSAAAWPMLGALRASLLTLTPMGPSEGSPPMFLDPGGWFFYVEYAVGLAFLIVIINVVLSYMAPDKAE